MVPLSDAVLTAAGSQGDSTMARMVRLLTLVAVLLVAQAWPVAAATLPPTITSVSPASAARGATVTINGSSFTGTTKVTFNGVTSTFSVVNQGKITAPVPAAALTGSIKVTTPAGTATSPSPFTVRPTLSLTPGLRPPTGPFTIAGAAFGANELVDLYWDAATIGFASTNDSGDFAARSATVPRAADPGDHWITAVGRRSGASVQKVFQVHTSWAQVGFNAHNTRSNPFENTIDPGNVKSLKLAWVGQAGDVVTPSPSMSTPVVGRGVVYVGAGDGKLYAFDLDGCGTPAGDGTCGPLWRGNVPYGGNPTAPAVTFDVGSGIVIVGTDRLSAFAVGCGTAGALCPELWRTPGVGQLGSPVIANGHVFVGSAEGPSSANGRLYAYGASGCGSPPCAALWSTAYLGAPVYTEPTVWNGQVYVTAANQVVASSADGCLIPPCAAVGSWGLTASVAASSTAVAGTVYAPSSLPTKFAVWALDADACAAGSCQNPWYASVNTTNGGLAAGVAVADGRLFMASADRVLRSIDAGGCDAYACGFDWAGGAPSPSAVAANAPAVANGVAYVTFADGSVRAFAADGCGASVCSPLWKVKLSPAIHSAPIVADGTLLVTADNGKIYAFTLAGEGVGSNSVRPDPASLRRR